MLTRISTNRSSILILLLLTLCPSPLHAQAVVASGPTVYVSTFDGTNQQGGNVLKVDVSAGTWTVLFPNTSPGGGQLSPAILDEDMAIGPDAKLYVTDGLNNRILRMNQDGTQAEVIYNQATSGSCGGTGCPTGPEGPTFYRGDLFFNTRENPGAPHNGVWRIPRIGGIPFGGPFPRPVEVLTAAQTLNVCAGRVFRSAGVSSP
jgi:hypothetical protein